MKEKDAEKRFTQLEKRTKELDDRLAKLEKAWKKWSKKSEGSAPEESIGGQGADMGPAVAEGEDESADT